MFAMAMFPWVDGMRRVGLGTLEPLAWHHCCLRNALPACLKPTTETGAVAMTGMFGSFVRFSGATDRLLWWWGHGPALTKIRGRPGIPPSPCRWRQDSCRGVAASRRRRYTVQNSQRRCGHRLVRIDERKRRFYRQLLGRLCYRGLAAGETNVEPCLGGQFSKGTAMRRPDLSRQRAIVTIYEEFVSTSAGHAFPGYAAVSRWCGTE